MRSLCTHPQKKTTEQQEESPATLRGTHLSLNKTQPSSPALGPLLCFIL